MLFVLGVPCASACLAPPAILEGKTLPLESVMYLYPPESRFPSLPKCNGESLRGAFVPAGEGAPVVLHLFDSAGSLGGIGTDLAVVARQLRELGLASLFFDYTGVGLSQGERSVENLLPDAELAWQEALRLAGGDPQRVVIRAISLGTIAAAELLASGVRPRMVLAYAPVFPDTVVPRFAREFHGWPAWLFASLFYRPITRLDPCAVIESSGVPWHVIGSAKDSLLSGKEWARLKTAVEASGGGWHEAGGDHLFLGMIARRVGREELALVRELGAPDAPEHIERLLGAMSEDLRARFPEGSQERRQFEELARTQRDAWPLELAAAALANEDWVASWRMLWLSRIRPYPPLPFEDRVVSLSVRGPRDDLSLDLIELLSAGHDLAWRYEGSRSLLAPSVVGALAARHGEAEGGGRYEVEYKLACGLRFEVEYDLLSSWIWFLAGGSTPWEANVELAQTILKSLRIPDRLQRLPDGSLRLEAFWEGKWELVPCSPEERAPEPNAASSARRVW